MFKPISRGELGGSLTKHFSGVLYTLICPKHICADHAPTTPTQFIFFALHRSLYFFSFHPFLTLRSILTTPFLPSFALPLSPLLLSLLAHYCTPSQPLPLPLSIHFHSLSLPTFAPPISPILLPLSAYFCSSFQPTFAPLSAHFCSPYQPVFIRPLSLLSLLPPAHFCFLSQPLPLPLAVPDTGGTTASIESRGGGGWRGSVHMGNKNKIIYRGGSHVAAPPPRPSCAAAVGGSC